MNAHSPLGASGAERWMKCPGSVALIEGLNLPETDEPDYRKEGTAGHEAAAHCLQTGQDAWEVAGATFAGVEISAEMADAIQVYLDTVRPTIDLGARVWIEEHVSSAVHEKFYGTVDFGAVHPGFIEVVDLKMGEGITVEAAENPQLMYYAFGLIDKTEKERGEPYKDDMDVAIKIVQPRAFHPDGPVREWWTDVGTVKKFIHDVLVPAMLRTEMEKDFDTGAHCRFCPAKLICPKLTQTFRAIANAPVDALPDMDDETFANGYPLLAAAEMYIKAYKDEALRRLLKGADLSAGCKLVQKKATRVFKDGAEMQFVAYLGEDAFTKPVLKSPAEMEKLGASAKKLVREWAYTPDTGYTVAGLDDKRIAVKVQTSQEAFGAAVASLNPPEQGM